MKKGSASGTHLGDVQQIILIADLGELGPFLVRAHAGHVIGILAVQADQVFACRFGQGRLGEEIRQTRVAAHQAVFAEMLLVEKGAGGKIVFLYQLVIQELGIAFDLDA